MIQTVSSLSPETRKALQRVACFYDRRKVGDAGALGFRRSTDLSRLIVCLDTLIERHYLIPGESAFLDLGCADGRVNLLFSYLVSLSVGIEIDEWTLDEFEPLRGQLLSSLAKDKLPRPPKNIFLFHGDSTDDTIHETVRERTGAGFEQFDIFYTYLTMQEEFAELIARRGKAGSLFMVYGLDTILPRFKCLRLLTPKRPMEGILALYRKE